MIYRNILLVLIIVLGISCRLSKTTISPDELKNFNTLITSKTFTIESDWAYPQLTNAVTQVFTSQLLPPGSNASAINLIGNANFLTIKGDSVTSYMPYFGERQILVGYGTNNNGAIEFNGIMKDYAIEDGKDGSKIITFNAMSKSENFNVTITLFPNFKSDIYLWGTGRFPIQYSGNVESLPLKDSQS